MSVDSLLGCPRCHRPIVEETPGSFSCPSCGKVARRTLGFVDFIGDQQTLPMASGGVTDLGSDQVDAERLLARADRLTFPELQALSITKDTKEPEDGAEEEQQRQQKRLEAGRGAEWEQIGTRHGRSILEKANAHLSDEGLAPIAGKWALEAAGGHGLFVPDFSTAFDGVVFVDCLLTHLVLARKLAEECGVKNAAFVRADVMALPFRDGVFDFVHENNVIEHVADPWRMVQQGLRVLSPTGTYVCLSPNRFPISTEPHFLLPGFGFFPRPIRKKLIRWRRGVDSEAGTDLRSLGQLKRYFAAAGAPDPSIFFLPRRLKSIARNTPVRRAVQAALDLPAVGWFLSAVVNGPLLPIMPYHMVVTRRREPSPRA